MTNDLPLGNNCADRASATTDLRYDPSRAHSGRVHDFLIGAGKDSYPVDREVGEKLLAESDAFRVAARAARLFLVRAVQHLAANEGICQIVELGSGYPCRPNLHEVARQAAPSAHTLYIDNDPVVAAHGRALLADEQTHFVHADLTDTDAVTHAIGSTMNTSEPLAICLGFVCEFLPDPRLVLDAVFEELPAGSCVVLSHVTSDVDAQVAGNATEVYRGYGIDFRARSRSEIATILAGFELVEPGFVAPHRWRPGNELDRVRAEQHGWAPPQDVDICCFAAVGQCR